MAAKISCCRSSTVNLSKSTWRVVVPLGCLRRIGAMIICYNEDSGEGTKESNGGGLL